jgi:acyl carrier protein
MNGDRMSEAEIYDGLNHIFRDVFDDPKLAVTPELSARDVPEWDSFNHINIIVAAEMRFGVKFRTVEIDALRNVGEFVRLIARKREIASA